MTAKEKAKELIDQFHPLVTNWDCYWDRPMDPEEILPDQKKCAIIVVEEMMGRS